MPNIGKISRIIGPVVDVSFAENAHLPKIYSALEITKENGQKVVLEVQQHLGEDRVRAVAMDSTDGLLRGMPVLDLESAIKMPVGENIKGRVFNVVGDAIDGIANLDKTNGRPIHANPPRFEDLSTEAEILFTGIKVIRAICKRW
jgi:F-type H+-transporting ATPase subunit beta